MTPKQKYDYYVNRWEEWVQLFESFDVAYEAWEELNVDAGISRMLCKNCASQITHYVKKCPGCGSDNVFIIDFYMADVAQYLINKGYNTCMSCDGVHRMRPSKEDLATKAWITVKLDSITFTKWLRAFNEANTYLINLAYNTKSGILEVFCNLVGNKNNRISIFKTFFSELKMLAEKAAQ